MLMCVLLLWLPGHNNGSCCLVPVRLRLHLGDVQLEVSKEMEALAAMNCFPANICQHQQPMATIGNDEILTSPVVLLRIGVAP